MVTCFTISNFAPYGGSTDIEVVTGIRAAEDREFAARLGISESVIDLGRLDAPIRLRRHFTRVCAGGWLSGQDKNEIDEVSRLIDLAVPTGALIVPLAVGDHIDHRIVNAAAVKAGANRIAGFYEDLPYSISACSSEILIKLRDAERQIRSSLVPIHILDPERGAAKFYLISAYKSQLPPPDLLRIASHRSHGQFGERLWVRPEVAEAWQSAGLQLRHAQRPDHCVLRLRIAIALFKAQGLARRGARYGRRVARLTSVKHRSNACSTN